MKVENRKFHRDYQEIEKYEAGIMLSGAEVKTVKEGGIRLEESFVRITDNEAYLVNANVPIYKFSRPQDYDPKRTRKLLLHKKELLRLRVKMAGSGRLTIVPVSCYNKGRLIKLEIALVKGRGEIEKKKLDKKRDIERDQKREAKEYMKE